MFDLEIPWIAQSANALVLSYAGGRVVRYRIRDGVLEFKANDTAPWLLLSPEQTVQHLVLKTPVGEWLQNRITWEVKELGLAA